ncbi:hypothetical protein UlMin_022387 [Ulmus minor]
MASDDVVSNLSSSDDEKYGFRRPEMYQTNLAGTASLYDRHVFLCYKNPESWAPKVEASDDDPLPKLLASAIKARKDDITVKTLLTICEGRDGTEFSDGDVLIFPDMIKYRGLKDSEVDSFVEDVLVNGKPWASGVQEVFAGTFVFVCSHASRDKRCGVCGPVLIDKFKDECELRALTVFVLACSHIGGHKYAGNLIIYSPGPDEKVMGHWYGYVTPEDIPEFLDQHIAKGEIIERLWRGQMGVSAKESEKADGQKLPNGVDTKKSKNEQESESQVTKENFAGCCQGANGVSCCRDASVEQNGTTEGNKVKEISKKGPLGKLCSWIGSREQKDVLGAVAVVGAVATVAVAYSYYRRSR